MQRSRRSSQEASAVYEARPPLFVLLASLLLYFTRFGYDYASGDQDEVIPYLLHRLDPGLFTQDWFVNIQISEFSIRTYFVWLINALALLLPVWLSVLIIYVITWLVIAAAVYKLAFHFTKDQIAACAAVVGALILTPVWTLGGNDLLHNTLVASQVAWAFGLWAVYHFMRARYLLAPVLLGVACWFQALVGLHLGILLFLVRVIKFGQGERGAHTPAGIAAFGALFALWSSPALGPIIYQQFFAQPTNFNPDPSLFYILAEFRLPHHYLPFSFHMHNVVRFVLLMGGSIAALAWKPFRVRLQDSDIIITLLALIAGFCVVATVFTELIPILFVAKLQLFKMTVLAKLFFVIILSGAFFFWLPAKPRSYLQRIVRRPGRGLVLVSIAALAIVGAAVLGDGFFHNKVEPFRRADAPIGQVQEWARRQTSYGAIFAVPPSMSTFRSEAQRTIVVNYKAIPYEDEQMVTWFNRLTDLAPIELPERGSADLMAKLDSAYETLTAQRLVELSREYNIDYVLRQTPLDSPGPYFEQVFQADNWIAYERIADSLATPSQGAQPDTLSAPSETLAAPAGVPSSSAPDSLPTNQR